MLKQWYEELRSIPVPLTHEHHQQLLTTTFCRLIDTLRSAATISHPQINALAGLMYEVVSQHLVPVARDRDETPRISFTLWQRPDEPPFPLIMLPTTYLEQVREDPLHQLVGIVSIASNVRDYLCQVLALPATEVRARAFEAELLVCWRQKHEQEGLAWTPNAHQQAVLEHFPRGLESLPQALAYPTPELLIFRDLQ
jgi:hypothetical protein